MKVKIVFNYYYIINMANTKISQLTANTNPTWLEELVYAYDNGNGKMTLNTMKSFVWWAWITELNADANIWELTEWIYVTTHDLYYTSWNKVETGSLPTTKQMIFVTAESTGEKAFLVYNVGHYSSNVYSFAWYWYSVSSTSGTFYMLGSRTWAFQQYEPYSMSSINPLDNQPITQVVSNISWANELSISSSNPPYPWVTYTIYVESVSSSYTVSLWTWVTNPFNITLPSNSNKKCLITVLITSSTTGIVTGCTIES